MNVLNLRRQLQVRDEHDHRAMAIGLIIARDARPAGLRPRGPGLTVVGLAEVLQFTADRSSNKGR